MLERKINKKSAKIRHELNRMRVEANLVYKETCTAEENKEFRHMRREKIDLPDNVCDRFGTGEFIRIHELDLTEAEQIEYLLLKQNEQIQSIKSTVGWVLFLTASPIVISLVILILSNIA